MTRVLLLLQKYVLLIFFLLISNSLIAQSSIRGIIKDTKDSLVPYATIIVKSVLGDSILTYTTSNENGIFNLKIKKTGRIRMIVSSLSYYSNTLYLIVSNKDIDTTINLLPVSNELSEVIIKSELPIVIKKDTIIYNVKSFMNGREQVIEDILRQLPGISVDKDGIVSFGNQEVDRVMVEGSDIFDKGYTILTKNMPTKPVSKIELIKHFSSNKQLKGIEKSERIALNIVIEDSVRRQWFGNLYLGEGYGETMRHDLGFNLMNFGKKSQFYFLGNSNNIGKDATGDLNKLIHPNISNENNSIGDDQSFNELISINPITPPELSKNRTNLNLDHFISINSILSLSKKIKLKILGFYNSTKQNYYNNNFDSIYNVANPFVNREFYSLEKKSLLGIFRADIIYDINANTLLEYTFKGNTESGKIFNKMLFNQKELLAVLNNSNSSIDHKVSITNKLKNNSVLLFNARFISNKLPQTHTLNNFLYDSLFYSPFEANNIVQNGTDNMFYFGLKVSYLKRFKKATLLELTGGKQFRKDYIQSNFYINKDDTIILEPTKFSNKFYFSTNDYFFGGKIIYKLRNIDLSVSLFGHSLKNQFLSYLPFADNKAQNYLYIVPLSGIFWQINDRNTLKLNYAYQKTNSKANDLINGYIYTGFNTFDKGTDEPFNPLVSSKASIQYIVGNWSDKFFISSSAAYFTNIDYLSSEMLVSKNFVQSKKTLLKNRTNYLFSLNVDRYINKISNNINLLISGSSSDYKSSLNGLGFRDVSTRSFDYGFSIRSMFSGNFNYNLGTKWSYRWFSIASLGNSYTNNNSFVDIGLSLSKKVNIQLFGENYLFGNLAKGSNSFYFADFKLQYISKANKLVFKLLFQNIFDTKNFRQYNINDFAISINEFRLQPRSFLVTGEIRF